MKNRQIWQSFIGETYMKGEHPFDDFQAFEKWMNEKSENTVNNENDPIYLFMEIWENSCVLERIGIYSVICDILIFSEKNANSN